MRKILMSMMILALVTVVCLISAKESKAELPAARAVILFMKGEVKVRQAGQVDWQDAVKGMALSDGDMLKTGLGSWAEVGIGKGYKNVVRIQEQSLVEMQNLGPVEVNLLKGELRSLVEKLSTAETFEIKTPMSVCGVRGTGWDTNYSENKVVVDVYEDEVYFAGVTQGGGSMEDPIIKSGKRGILVDPLKAIKIEGLPAGKMRDWKKWKQNFLRRNNAGEGLEEKTEGAEDGLQEMMKGKSGIFEKSDQDYIEKRLEKGDSGIY